MNQHAVSSEMPGGYRLALRISRKWLRIVGLCAIAAAVVIVILANATEPFRAPLGIALAVVAITLLIAVSIESPVSGKVADRRGNRAGAGNRRTPLGRMWGRRPVAAELALLAELHAKGALSDEEFSLAKLRTLGK